MNRIGAAATNRLDDTIHIEICLAWREPLQTYGVIGLAHMERGGIRVGMDGNRFDPHAPCRSDDPSGNLSTVGYKQSFHRRYRVWEIVT